LEDKRGVHRNSAAEELRATGMPLGLMPGMSYEENEMVLDAGEAALFYSDGLVEAHDPKAICPASLGLGRSSLSTVRRGLWGAYFLRNSTLS
jgi:hypothetical protein